MALGQSPKAFEQPTREAHASGGGDTRIWNHSNQGTAQPRDSDIKEVSEPQTTDMNDQTG